MNVISFWVYSLFLFSFLQNNQGTATAKQLRKFLKKIGIELQDLSTQRIAEIISSEGNLEFTEDEFVVYMMYNSAFLENLRKQKEAKEKADRALQRKPSDESDESTDIMSVDLDSGRR